MSRPLATLGRKAHANRLIVIGLWIAIAAGLGVFAPRLEHALSGAMWEVNGSHSLAARQILEKEFGGFSSQSAVVVLHSDELTFDSPEFQARIAEASQVLASEETLTPAVAQPSWLRPHGAGGDGRSAHRHRSDRGGRITRLSPSSCPGANTSECPSLRGAAGSPPP